MLLPWSRHIGPLVKLGGGMNALEYHGDLMR